MTIIANRGEEIVREAYEERGYITLRRGEPDFIFVKTDEGKIDDAIFVEVKSCFSPLPRKLGFDPTLPCKLNLAQQNYKAVLEWIGAKYRVEYVEFIGNQEGKMRKNAKCGYCNECLKEIKVRKKNTILSGLRG